MAIEKKFEVSKDLVNKVYEAIEIAKNSGKIRKGTNEATKSIERGEAKLVAIAEDVDPAEIVMHIPVICGEKKIPFVYVPNKVELGKASGVDVGTAAVAIAEEGDAAAVVKDIISKLSSIKK
ncbi:MAG: 50S ribosomal protein L7ae [Candidatus Aenigmarchaeota archaeon]|nr:50S ribosomal protein L7ae [Candidatus Aenigmarchaeota archaeon]